jgi:hypothetical protein
VVARRDVTRLERSIRPSRKGKGALIGLAVGFGAGFAAAAALGNCSEVPGVVEHCANPAASSIFGAIAGARSSATWRVLSLAGAHRGAVVAVFW